jgi:hypothetical protein
VSAAGGERGVVMMNDQERRTIVLQTHQKMKTGERG